MEGRGVINFATGKPSYGFSTATTEFDDALISRGVITFEQAMIAKGASSEEARKLADLETGRTNSSRLCLHGSGNIDHSKQDNVPYSDSEDETDEQFLQTYRRMRINDMKRGRRQEYGEVIPISRPDWNREVNEASRDGLWAIVNLTRSSTTISSTHDELCDKVEQITNVLADRFVDVKFVSIPSTSAIENWPDENLPTLFCYRYGKMQHQLIGIDAMGGTGVNNGRLEWRLARLGVLETDLKEDPDEDRVGMLGVRYGESMSRRATTRVYESDDYDNVD
ncbi:hypothetical protein ACHAWF_004352 [Thalassiosira exigua]